MTPTEILFSTLPFAMPIRVPAGRGDLPFLFGALGYTKGAEIGVWEGGYSEKLCRGLPGLELLCVDPWEPYSEYRERKNDPARLDEAYTTTVERLRPYGCRILRKTSREAAALVPDCSLDFVYLDGNHLLPYVLEDLALWAPKVRQGGILAGHDYRVPVPEKDFIQVKPAVDTYVDAHGIRPWFVLSADKSPSFFWMVA